MSRYIYLFVFVILNISVYAQSTFYGNISTTQENLEFASILLKDINDTSKILYGTISDMQGNYRIEKLNYGKYLLEVSMIGYLSIADTIIIEQNETIRNIILSEIPEKLKEVIVKSEKVKVEIDKNSYYIMPDEKKNASSSINLLEKIPKIIVDKTNNTISSINGKKIKILINGMNSSETDLLSLNPNQVIKIEHYAIPPVRYANSGYDGVVNIITKKSTQGISGTLNTINAYSTGFGNNLLNLKYNNKQSQFSLSYFFSYRKHNNRTVDDELKYSINDSLYTKLKTGVKSPFIYQLNVIDLEYIIQKDSNFTFRAKFSPTLYVSDRKNNQNIKYLEILDTIIGKGLSVSSLNEFQPVLDLYFEKTFSKKKKLIIDIVPSLYETNYKSTIIETVNNNDTSLFDNNKTNNNKYSLITESCYSTYLKNHALNFGIKYSYFNSSQNVINKFGINYYSTISSEQYGYGEIMGNLNKIKYKISVGLSNNYFIENTDKNKYNFLIFLPSVNFGYLISDKINIALNYIKKPEIPSLSQLSHNIFMIDKRIIFSGNSQLKPYSSNNFNLTGLFQSSNFILSPEVNYIFAKNPILSNYTFINNYILETYNNEDWFSKYNLGLSCNYNPFKSNIFNLVFYSEVFRQQNKINTNTYSMYGLFYNITINLNYKNISFNLQYKSNYKYLLDKEINTDGENLLCMLQYKIKKLIFGIGVYNPFIKSWYSSSETIPNLSVYNKNTVNIFDNGSMMVFNFSFNFLSGKNYNETAKILNNSDNDSGILKIDK